MNDYLNKIITQIEQEIKLTKRNLNKKINLNKNRDLIYLLNLQSLLNIYYKLYYENNN